uniref:Uncharacterized protein n=1 Tax=Rhizophora mucronata TaxID=61149 RepID=A0A2P2N898_RHIMU
MSTLPSDKNKRSCYKASIQM